MEASRELRTHLAAGERVGRKMITQLKRGAPIHECVTWAGENASDLRQSATDVQSAFERRRHEMRIAFIRAVLDSGMSMGDIAREMGVSRQRIQKLASEG